jgi:mycothiol synthase
LRRPATADDAAAILAVAVARDIADVGEPDWSIQAVRDELAAAAEAVVVEESGEVVAFAMLNGVDARVVVHPDACARGIGTALREWAEERAAGDVIRQEGNGADPARIGLLERAGYRLADRYLRMVRELDGSEPEPDWPDGVVARALERGHDERAAYDVVSAAMRGVPGSTERSFEEWSARALGKRLTPELSLVAEAGGSGVGVLLAERDEDRDGLVDYLAVAPAWQGRGLGRALLRAALAGFAAAGLRRVVLWVHGDNESATALYSAAGMHVSFSGDRWVKRLR